MTPDEALRGLLEKRIAGEDFHLHFNGVEVFYIHGREQWYVSRYSVGSGSYFGHVEDAIRCFAEMLEEEQAERE